MNIKTIRSALKELYASKTYWAITFSMITVLLLFNILIINYHILFSTFSFTLLGALLIGTVTSMAFSTLALLFALSVLGGIVTAMSVFLIARQMSIGASSSSVLASIIAPACPSCGIGLLSMLGFGGFLSILPFKGLELGIAGIAILVLSIAYLAKKVVTKTCTV